MFDPNGTHFKFYGRMGDRIGANQENWFKAAPIRSPRMIGVFQERKTGPTPPASLLAWVGEYAGKYLIGAIQALRLSGDPDLRDVIVRAVRDLIQAQGDDGYLGPFGPGERLTNRDKWDLWGHYHCMLGLLLWHQDQNDPDALAACRRAADLLCATFLGTGTRVADAGNPEKNEAVAHVLILLHRATGDARYLQMVREIEVDWGRIDSDRNRHEDGGNYVDGFQHNEPFYLGRETRWESLHDVQAVAELYAMTLDWQPWFALGPNVFPAGSAVTALSMKPGETSLYVLGLDRQVWSKFFDPQNPGPPELGGWHPWFPLGPNVFPAGSPVAALSTKPGGTSLYVLGLDGQVWSKFFDPQNPGPPELGGWHPWFTLGPNVFPAGSAVTVLSTKPGGTSLYVLGLDGHVWSKFFDPQNPGPPELGGWQPWFPLGPNVFPVGSTVTALSTKPGGTSLYVLGFDRQVWSKFFDPQNLGPPEFGGWHPWFPLGPNVFPVGSAVTALSTKPGGTSLYVLGLDGQVWSKFFDPQNPGPPELGGWHPWFPLGPNVFPVGSRVAALSTTAGGSSLYVPGPDGKAWSKYFDPQNPGPPEFGGWQPWFALGPNVYPAGSRVTALSTKPGATSLFVPGPDGQVWSTYFDPQHPGSERYLRAFTTIWRSIQQSDRHITGGFSSLEAAHGNPFDPRPIETCATIGWMCLTLDMLRLIEEAQAADELELSTWNAVFGSQSADATWWTYDTPMGGISTSGMGDLGLPAPLAGPPRQIGERCPTLYDLRWQEATGVQLLSCCALNGPRGLAMLSQWAVMRAENGIAVNYYGPCDVTAGTPAGHTVLLSQSTDYPISGAIRFTVTPEQPERFVLRLRIPGWSDQTRATVNGQAAGPVQAGSYLALDRVWSSGDTVELEMDMGPRFVPGARKPPSATSDGDATGRMAIYYGPLLLAYDSRFDRYAPDALPVIDRTRGFTRLPAGSGVWEPVLLLRFPTLDGQTLTLCDFASAGTVPWIPSRRWRFSRGDGTILSPELTLRPDGTIQGSTHPNETRWGFQGTSLTFYDAGGTATTRFTPVYVPNDRTHLEGKFLPDPAITHVLTQLDSDITETIWEFVRATSASPIRLDPDGRIHGYQHPNEASWKMDGDTLVFCNQLGQPTTRFTESSRVGEHRELAGRFEPDPSIVHRLRELDLGWVRGTAYISWLPAIAPG